MLVLRWVLLGLYLALIAGLSVPFFFDPNDTVGIWLVLIGVMIASQALCILGSGTINLCWPLKKSRLWMPVLAATVMAFVLVGGITLALAELIMEDRDPGPGQTVLVWGLLLGNWVFWAPLLWAYTRRKQRRDVVARLAGWLFVGSLAELLICVPSHIMTSRRSYCLAGVMTMLGIVAGVYVMLFSFGPALAVLFLRPRYRREMMERQTTCMKCHGNLRSAIEAGRDTCPQCGLTIDPRCPRCDYDLRGTIAAGHETCPECGFESSATGQMSGVVG